MNHSIYLKFQHYLKLGVPNMFLDEVEYDLLSKEDIEYIKGFGLKIYYVERKPKNKNRGKYLEKVK